MFNRAVTAIRKRRKTKKASVDVAPTCSSTSDDGGSESSRKIMPKLLSGDRVSKMTRTYDDPEALTRLLEEKEKDLELTVQIGKELLSQNAKLEGRVAELESELKASGETMAQLNHELSQKNGIISILTNDVETDGDNASPTQSKSINLDLLQHKISSLEAENKQLRCEVSQIAKQTDEVEEQERRLMEEYTSQLTSANNDATATSLELERCREENRLQQEQIAHLTARLSAAESRLRELSSENDEKESLLGITSENQSLLVAELAELKERYQEIFALLQETQEQLRRQRRRAQPAARSSLFRVPQADSLHTELMETSIFSDHSLDSGIASDQGGAKLSMSQYSRVFETVRCANANIPSDLSSICSSRPRVSSFASSSDFSAGRLGRGSSSSAYADSSISNMSTMGDRCSSRESLSTNPDEVYPGQSSGVPGAPGAKDLESALKRLTPAEVMARRAMLGHAPAGSFSYDEAPHGIPLGCRTPDSIMSTGSSNLSGGALSTSSSSASWRLPEKLQIVKPLEGSLTLRNWSKLATPTLGGLLEERSGVAVRGGRTLDDLGLQTYSLSDVEEDEELIIGKRFQESVCVYTYTNSTVLHPDDGTSVTFSLPPSQMSSVIHSTVGSRQTTAPPTPRAGLSRRNSCSTFSVHMGLASMLNERGIKAVTPSVLNTPAGPNSFTPTATPSNSPEGSPTRCLSPSADQPLLTGLLVSGAELLRRKLIGEMDTSPRSSRRLEKRALKSLRIMERVESIGLDNMLVGSSLGRVRTSSPMTQLTSLKGLKPGDDNFAFDKETIKAVLHKGLAHDTSPTAPSTSPESDSDGSIIEVRARPPKKPEREKPSAAAATTADQRAKQMFRQKSRRSMRGNGTTGAQRPDLGTVRPSSGKEKKSPPAEQEERHLGVVGTISSLLFGRKGGFT